MKLSGQSTSQPNRNPPPTHTNMNINSQTALDLHRNASVALHAAEANLHRAEQAVAAARKVKELADALYEAAITEQVAARLSGQQK